MSTKMEIISFYGFAKNPKGDIEQMIIKIREGKIFSREFTGKIYETGIKAFGDVCCLNQGTNN
ncbi:MAG: hypothetical protein E3J87_09140 [Candidatus Cloacimonadota bacterium]|nr:MAG: hypothetical protein E3J87_09140 [Candidatus Cloacimonadota bacterium]